MNQPLSDFLKKDDLPDFGKEEILMSRSIAFGPKPEVHFESGFEVRCSWTSGAMVCFPSHEHQGKESHQ